MLLLLILLPYCHGICPTDLHDWGKVTPFRADAFPSYVVPIRLFEPTNATNANPGRRLLALDNYEKSILHSLPFPIGTIAAIFAPVTSADNEDGLRARLESTNRLASEMSGVVAELTELAARETADRVESDVLLFSALNDAVADLESFRVLSDTRYRNIVSTLQLLSLSIDMQGQANVRLSHIDRIQNLLRNEVGSSEFRKWITLATLASFTDSVPFDNNVVDEMEIIVAQPYCDVYPNTGKMAYGCNNVVNVKRYPTMYSYFLPFDSFVYTEEYLQRSIFNLYGAFGGAASSACIGLNSSALFKACVSESFLKCFTNGVLNDQCLLDPDDAVPWGVRTDAQFMKYPFAGISTTACRAAPLFADVSSVGDCSVGFPWTRTIGGVLKTSGCGGALCDAQSVTCCNNASAPGCVCAFSPACSPGIRTCRIDLDVPGPQPTYFAIDVPLPASYMWTFLGNSRKGALSNRTRYIYITQFFDPIEIMAKAYPRSGNMPMDDKTRFLFESGNRGDNIVFAHYGNITHLPMCMREGSLAPVICDPAYFPFSSSMLTWLSGNQPLTGWNASDDCQLINSSMCCRNFSYDATSAFAGSAGWNPFLVPNEMRNEPLFDRLLFLTSAFNNFTSNQIAMNQSAVDRLNQLFGSASEIISLQGKLTTRARAIEKSFSDEADRVAALETRSSTFDWTLVGICCLLIICVVCLYKSSSVSSKVQPSLDLGRGYGR